MSLNAQIIKNIKNENNSLLKEFTKVKNFNLKFQSYKKFKTVIIIGMGGSILGAKAIYSFLRHKIKKKFIFIDNLDEQMINQVKKKNNLSNSLFLIISKSGNTNETVLNTFFFKSFLKKKNTIVLSESKNSFLRKFAKNNNFLFVEHKKYIGGRYSVLSDVGILPAYFMGLNIKNFQKTSKKFIHNKKFLFNSIQTIKKLKVQKSNIIILFNYIPELNDFLYWSQQLFAESLGKSKKGFMPIVSNAPKDHHSLLQLYLDGPKDKIFYVFSTKNKINLKTNSKFFGKEMQHLNKKTYNDIKLSQKNAFVKVIKSKKIPIREIFVKKIDEKNICELFLTFIFETILLGKIMKVNPFNQPAVENVKILTKKILNSK